VIAYYGSSPICPSERAVCSCTVTVIPIEHAAALLNDKRILRRDEVASNSLRHQRGAELAMDAVEGYLVGTDAFTFAINCSTSGGCSLDAQTLGLASSSRRMRAMHGGHGARQTRGRIQSLHAPVNTFLDTRRGGTNSGAGRLNLRPQERCADKRCRARAGSAQQESDAIATDESDRDCSTGRK
jgi:hypothetical protein